MVTGIQARAGNLYAWIQEKMSHRKTAIAEAHHGEGGTPDITADPVDSYTGSAISPPVDMKSAAAFVLGPSTSEDPFSWFADYHLPVNVRALPASQCRQVG